RPPHRLPDQGHLLPAQPGAARRRRLRGAADQQRHVADRTNWARLLAPPPLAQGDRGGVRLPALPLLPGRRHRGVAAVRRAAVIPLRGRRGGPADPPAPLAPLAAPRRRGRLPRPAARLRHPALAPVALAPAGGGAAVPADQPPRRLVVRLAGV